MALPEIDAICRNCSARFRAGGKHDLFGFRTLTCPSCGKAMRYPLTSGYRALYWAIAVIMVLVVGAAFLQGKLAAPGLLGLVSVYALVVDTRVKREVEQAEADAELTEPR